MTMKRRWLVYVKAEVGYLKGKRDTEMLEEAVLLVDKEGSNK